MSKEWEIIIFCASNPEYANTILDQIDPDQKYFSFRLYRKDCYHYEDKDYYIKDLRIIDRPLNRMVIVDDRPESYGFQIHNGIPILPFKGEADDGELLLLKEYLDYLKVGSDFQKINKDYFKNNVVLENRKITDIFRNLFC